MWNRFAKLFLIKETVSEQPVFVYDYAEVYERQQKWFWGLKIGEFGSNVEKEIIAITL
ncbi:MAG: hypothetical protein JW947_02240 [Sedimentisphaerales bacterium]|nr:hypothetical protein [Sedimentisphaerales bacterium]